MDVIPSIFDGLVEAIRRRVEEGKVVNVHYFYRILCTKDNMTLVHRRCHGQKPHEGFNVDPERISLTEQYPDDVKHHSPQYLASQGFRREHA